jgi:hypothetical protein
MDATLAGVKEERKSLNRPKLANENVEVEKEKSVGSLARLWVAYPWGWP